MARQVELSESEILEALREARRVRIPDPPGVFVISELAAKSGQAARTIRAQVAVLNAKGQIESVKVYREGSDGRQIMVTAHRILRAPKAKR